MHFTYDENLFSDLHKDARGFRPGPTHIFYSSTAEEKQRIWDSMCDELEEEIERERRDQMQAMRDFEDLIQMHISIGAKGRDQAIRWIIKATCKHEHDYMYGGSYICYEHGLPYHMASQFDPICKEILLEEYNEIA
jgi:hypothetical protein